MDSEQRAREPGEPRPEDAARLSSTGGTAGTVRPRRPWYRRRWLARTSTAVAFGLAGMLAVSSSLAAAGTDLRSNRQADLADLVRERVNEKEQLEEQARELRDEVDRLSAKVAGKQGNPARDRARKLGREVGLTPVRGSGVTVVLDDAPTEMRNQIDGGVNALVVHQQDIQAVANALWAAGAEAMTIQDQRVISTSAIRCVGNSVVLHGVPYPPPYRVSAIGDPKAMQAALETAPGVQRYLLDVDRYKLGYDVQTVDDLRLDGFDGSIDLAYASKG